jgi:hypothetical protein
MQPPSTTGAVLCQGLGRASPRGAAELTKLHARVRHRSLTAASAVGSCLCTESGGGSEFVRALLERGSKMYATRSWKMHGRIRCSARRMLQPRETATRPSHHIYYVSQSARKNESAQGLGIRDSIASIWFVTFVTEVCLHSIASIWFVTFVTEVSLYSIASIAVYECHIVSAVSAAC